MALRVKQSCSFDHDGSPVVLRRGQLVDDGHPYVAGREALFEAADDAALTTRAGADTSGAAETASAAPGERRAVTRPPKTTTRDGG